MRDETATGRDLLQHLRGEGFTVRADGEKLLISPASRLDADLRDRVRDAKPELQAALRREQVERLLDLAPVDPEMGRPGLPADEPATASQVERLRELASHDAFAEKRPRVREIVEEAVEGSLSQRAAYELIGELGRRIQRRKRRP